MTQPRETNTVMTYRLCIRLDFIYIRIPHLASQLTGTYADLYRSLCVGDWTGSV
jgi:hypothetical protein